MNLPILDELCELYELEDSPEDFEYIEVDSDYVSPNTFVDEDGTTWEVEYVGERDILEYNYFSDAIGFGFQVYGKPKNKTVEYNRLFQAEEQDEKFLLSELVGILNYRIRETDLLINSEFIVYQDRFALSCSALNAFVEVALLLNIQKDTTVYYDALSKSFSIETDEWNCYMYEYFYKKTDLNYIKVSKTDITKSLEIYEFTTGFNVYEQKVKKTIKTMHGKVDMFSFTRPSHPWMQCMYISKNNSVKIATDAFVLISNVDPRQTSIPTKKKEYQLLRRDGMKGGVGKYSNVLLVITSICYGKLTSIDKDEFIADIEYFNHKIKEARSYKKSLDISDVRFVTSCGIVLSDLGFKRLTLFKRNGIKTVEFNSSKGCLVLTDDIGGLCLYMIIDRGSKEIDNTAKWLDALKNGKTFNKHVIVRRK